MGVYYSAVSGYGFVIDHEEYMNCGDEIMARLSDADKIPSWLDEFEDDPYEAWSAFLHLMSEDVDILTSGSYYTDASYMQYLVCVNGQSNDGWGFNDSQSMPQVTDDEVAVLDYIREVLEFDLDTHRMGYYTGVLQS